MTTQSLGCFWATPPSSIAVDKALRGGGVGSVLMDSFEERARASGSTAISLDVSASNEEAIRFYKRRGMAIES
jgi:ribosomal protein S18 acetylase RimI-like enzyme